MSYGSNHCGTPQGMDYHKSRNEPACKWCKAAVEKTTTPAPVIVKVKAEPKPQKSRAKANPKKPVPPIKPPAKCATPAGYKAHLRRGEKACDECRIAANEARKKYARPSKAKKEPAPCGTPAAYQRHWRRGEKCERCKVAANEARAQYKRGKS